MSFGMHVHSRIESSSCALESHVGPQYTNGSLLYPALFDAPSLLAKGDRLAMLAVSAAAAMAMWGPPAFADPMASSAGQWWALDIAVSVPVAVAMARMLAVAISVLVSKVVPAREAVGMA